MLLEASLLNGNPNSDTAQRVSEAIAQYSSNVGYEVNDIQEVELQNHRTTVERSGLTYTQYYRMQMIALGMSIEDRINTTNTSKSAETNAIVDISTQLQGKEAEKSAAILTLFGLENGLIHPLVMNIIAERAQEVLTCVQCGSFTPTVLKVLIHRSNGLSLKEVARQETKAMQTVANQVREARKSWEHNPQELAGTFWMLRQYPELWSEIMTYAGVEEDISPYVTLSHPQFP